MDIKKLKLDIFKNININNFPSDINLGIESTSKRIEVVLYYIDKLEDINNFIKLCDSLPLPDENRTIMVFKKGQKTGVNQNSIMGPFKEGKYPKYKLKAPMLCSLSDELTACIFRKTE